MDKLLTFSAFCVLLCFILSCHTQKDKITVADHTMICLELAGVLCAPQEHSQVDKALRQSLAPFPWCSMEEGRKAEPAPHSGQEGVGELFPLLPTLHIHNISAKRDYCSCPLLSTKSHSMVSCASSKCHGLHHQMPLQTASTLRSTSLPTRAIYI